MDGPRADAQYSQTRRLPEESEEPSRYATAIKGFYYSTIMGGFVSHLTDGTVTELHALTEDVDKDNPTLVPQPLLAAFMYLAKELEAKKITLETELIKLVERFKDRSSISSEFEKMLAELDAHLALQLKKRANKVAYQNIMAVEVDSSLETIASTVNVDKAEFRRIADAPEPFSSTRQTSTKDVKSINNRGAKSKSTRQAWAGTRRL